MGSFWLKYIIFELKKYIGVVFNGIEDWSKNWGKIELRSKMAWGSWEIFTDCKIAVFFLENEMSELNKHKSSKQPDRSDAA